MGEVLGLPVPFWASLPLVAGLSALAVGGVRRYALRRSLLDVPNERSSHVVNTPRGGGLGVVLVWFLSLPVLLAASWIDAPLFHALFWSGLLVAGVGAVDDHGHVPRVPRLIVHALAAVGVAYGLVGRVTPEVLGVGIGWPPLVGLLAVLVLAWMLNLYNFMDGINGLAGLEGVSVCVGLAVLLLGVVEPTPVGQGLAVVSLVFACGLAGFLPWNYPRARIFMGDAGSGLVGFWLGVLVLHAAMVSMSLFWAALILLGVFVVDATYTLLRRALGDQPAHEAHHSHGYQILARRLGSHTPVSAAVVGVNALWLMPWAVAVAAGRVGGELALLVAWSPLVLADVVMGAGLPA